jgi:hypothetical protein
VVDCGFVYGAILKTGFQLNFAPAYGCHGGAMLLKAKHQQG